MKSGDQRRTLPAGGEVPGPKVRDNVNASVLGEERGVIDLYAVAHAGVTSEGACGLGLVPNGLPVCADGTDRGRAQVMGLE